VNDGRVLSVNVSAGGVPKLPVEHAWVGELGLQGDKHREMTVHGGPYRAVCLFAMEAIERLRAEGHPVRPGSVGDNLTTTGIEWSLLPGGTRARIGSELVIELTNDATPCETQEPNFTDRRFSRISNKVHPSDARMYARVVTPGEVRAGDLIELLPLPADNDPNRWTRLFDIDLAEAEADLRLWTAARAGGLEIDIVDADELVMAASSQAPEPPFNHAVGLRTVPELLPKVLDFYRRNGTEGRFGFGAAPWLGAEPRGQSAVLGADAADLAVEGPLPEGVGLRWLGPGEAADWAKVVVPVFRDVGFDVGVWEHLLPHLLSTRNVSVVVAERDHEPVGCGLLSSQRKVGLLRTGLVVPTARGHGIQRSLIRARIQRALELGCRVIAAQASPDSVSERNLRASGLRRLWLRDTYRFDPANDPAPELTERAVVA
jgi:MOSC domain-containing protein YiiM